MAIRSKQPEKEYPVCLLLNKDSALLGRGEIESDPEDLSVRVRVEGSAADQVADAEVVQIVPTDHQLAAVVGNPILRRGNLITFETIRKLGETVRQNFRIAVDFESYLYPKDGGKAFVRALDLSCGGIAMYSAFPLEVGEICEVAIPIIQVGPLLLDCEILRSTPYGGPIQLYAAKFVDVIDDQEALLREAVFQVQIEAMKASKAAQKSRNDSKNSKIRRR